MFYQAWQWCFPVPEERRLRQGSGLPAPVSVYKWGSGEQRFFQFTAFWYFVEQFFLDTVHGDTQYKSNGTTQQERGEDVEDEAKTVQYHIKAQKTHQNDQSEYDEASEFTDIFFI